jgi:hypothetical protein
MNVEEEQDGHSNESGERDRESDAVKNHPHNGIGDITLR